MTRNARRNAARRIVGVLTAALVFASLACSDRRADPPPSDPLAGKGKAPTTPGSAPRLVFEMTLPAAPRRVGASSNAVTISSSGDKLAYVVEDLNAAKKLESTLAVAVVGGKEPALTIPADSRGDRALRFSPDDRYLASADFNHLSLNEVATGTLYAKLDYAGAHHFGADGKFLAFLNPHRLKLWSIEKKEFLADEEFTAPNYENYAFADDGKSMVVVDRDGWVVWDLFPLRSRPPVLFKTKPLIFASPIVSGNGKTIAWQADGNEFLVAEAAGAERSLGKLEGSGSIRALSHDGTILVAGANTWVTRNQKGDFEPELRFFDVASGKRIASLPVHADEIHFARNGSRFVVSNSRDKSLKVYETPK